MFCHHTSNVFQQVTVTETDQFSFIVKFEEIKEIHNRRFQLKERAIEIFLLNGKTYLIAFNSQIVSVYTRYTFRNFFLLYYNLNCLSIALPGQEKFFTRYFIHD